MPAKTTKTNNVIKIWEKLHLAIGEPGKEGVYSCRVSDIKADKLIISNPAFQYGDSLLANNRVVQVRFTRADAAYSFKATLQEAKPKAPDTMLLVNLGKVERLQRRRFVRLDMVLPITYKIIVKPIDEPVSLNGEGLHKVRSLNVSAGGVLLQSMSQIKVNNLLLLDCSKCGLANLPSVVVAICRYVRQDEKKHWLAGLEFLLKDDLPKHLGKAERANLPHNSQGFESRLQNALVTELFTEQLIMRQKGIL
ncbi:MAG: flagellar brake domain-containing protein [candidate division Zixibacteria bacterium]|nr:flagellar brake domain-containing protein [candidate division Zixibacteria bacterium]